MSKRYRTAWPHVTVRIMDEPTGKKTVVAFGMDVIIPLSADPDDVKRLVAKGALVAETDPAEEKAEAEEAKRLAAKAKADAAAKAKADAQAKEAKEDQDAAATTAAADAKTAEEKAAATTKPAAGKADSKS